ncbi:MAG: RnfABCDGE type electron transport complex subunit G, partial [Pseudomonadota bacterium]
MTTGKQKIGSSLLTLGLIGLTAALLLTGVHQLTQQRIAEENQKRALASLHQLLPPERYDNDLINDQFTARIPGLSGAATIYRARLNNEPVALLADVVTSQGYSGDIRLLIALDVSGTVLGVRPINHRETPGLGDRIEVERSDWIEQFEGRSLSDPASEQWRADQRGGEFDTLSSATITSSAVIHAVRDVL